MADALNQRRAIAMQALDQFTDTWRAPLRNYIQAENHMPNLQVAINRLNLMINSLTDPAIVAGGVAVEVLNEEEMNEVRHVAYDSVIQVRNQIQVIQNYINGENNIDSLHNALERLNSINQDLIAALLP